MAQIAKLEFRLASNSDLTVICQIIAQAQAQMGALGSLQWQDGYPAQTDIAADINHTNGYVLADKQGIVAYGAVVFSGEQAYEALHGEWLTNGDYVVVHRLAVADRAKRQGIAGEFMLRTQIMAQKRGLQSFRVDTNFDNHYMLHLLANLGFVECGLIRYCGGERIAFEKII